MVSIRKFDFEINALYAAGILSNLGINTVLEEKMEQDERKFLLKVNEDVADKATSELDKIDFDETCNPESDGAIEGYNEWSDRMYDPGYYTGGRIPRFLLDKTNWKFFAPLYLASGLIMLYFMLRNAEDGLDLETLLWCGLFVFAGYSMLRQLKKRKK